jgi:porphobilinogen synthase
MRRLARETVVVAEDLIAPFFFDARISRPEPIEAMPGQHRWPPRAAVEACGPLVDAGISAMLLFGLPQYKDAEGTSGWQPDGPVQVATRAIKEAFPQLVVITDVCLCEYTDHGHCGLLQGRPGASSLAEREQERRIDNDSTLPVLARQALSHVAAGADMVAPSDMMDGRVGAVRQALDEHAYTTVPVMAYSAKYASAFYGPFREAAESAPAFGDRRSYQMDPGNVREALREVALDVAEGADIVMVKPALSYLDVIRRVRESVELPVAAYNVSGEYSMVKAAARAGWIDEDRAIREVITSIKRAGADMIISYHSLEVARWLKSGTWD